MLAREVARVARCYRKRLAVCKPGLDQFPERAANMAIFIASASARDAVLRNSLRAYPIELSEQGLVDELVLGSSLYLTGQKA